MAVPIYYTNHQQVIWKMDFFIVATLRFQVLYVLVLISHNRRDIQHVVVTAHHTAEWVVKQLREATPFDTHPHYLLHDNYSIFVSQTVTPASFKAPDITDKSSDSQSISTCCRGTG